MNTPNPLIPQGSLQQPARGKSTIRIAVFTIVAIHAVFFAGLLMQGCKRDDAAGLQNKPSDGAVPPNEFAKLDKEFYQPLPDPAAPTNALASTTGGLTGAYPGPATPSPLMNPTPAMADSAPAAASTESKEYTIIKGDTLSKIAKVQNVTVGDIYRANPGLDPRKLKVNQKILVPVATRSAASPAPVAGAAGGLGFVEPSKPEAGPATGGSVHVVKAGETLTKIAKQHNVSVKAIKSANQLKTDRLHVNQKLKLPAATASAAGGSHTTSASVEHALAPTAPTTLSATNPAGGTTVR